MTAMEEVFSPCGSSGMRPEEERESETCERGYDKRENDIDLSKEATFGQESEKQAAGVERSGHGSKRERDRKRRVAFCCGV